MSITMTFDRTALRRLEALGTDVVRQMPFILSRAMNDTAFAIRDAEIGQIVGAFDQPVSFVVRSPKVEKASKQKLEAAVYIDPRVDDVLVHHVAGGARLPRNVVRLMRGAGLLSGHEYTTYAPGYTNARGNLTLSRWRKIVDETKKRNGQYFIATINGQKAVWIRKGSKGRKVAPVVFIHGAAPRYAATFDFYGAGRREFARVAPRFFAEAIAKALSSTR